MEGNRFVVSYCAVNPFRTMSCLQILFIALDTLVFVVECSNLSPGTIAPPVFAAI